MIGDARFTRSSTIVYYIKRDSESVTLDLI